MKRSQEVANVQRAYARVLLIFLGIALLIAPLFGRSIPWYWWVLYAGAWSLWRLLPWKA